MIRSIAIILLIATFLFAGVFSSSVLQANSAASVQNMLVHVDDVSHMEVALANVK